MRTLNILVFGILLTNNVYASGVYGNLYDSSDLINPKDRYVNNPHKSLSEVKKEEKWRAKQEEEDKRMLNERIDEKLKGLGR